MAAQWFEYLTSLNKSKGPQAVKKLKGELEGYTLVGEYVGNPKCQHLVNY